MRPLVVTVGAVGLAGVGLLVGASAGSTIFVVACVAAVVLAWLRRRSETVIALAVAAGTAAAVPFAQVFSPWPWLAAGFLAVALDGALRAGGRDLPGAWGRTAAVAAAFAALLVFLAVWRPTRDGLTGGSGARLAALVLAAGAAGIVLFLTVDEGAGDRV